MIRFEHIWILHGLWALPILSLVFFLHLRWKRRIIGKWGNTENTALLMPGRSSTMPSIKFILYVIAYGLIILALANPGQGSRIETAKRKGIDIIVALDISNSMLATDVTPSRLTRTTQSLQRFIGKLSGDRIGLVLFAGKAIRILPITSDYSAANMIVSNINTRMVETQGTAIGAAIESAVSGFSKEGKRNKVIVIVSDGENHEDDAIAAAEKAFQQAIRIYTIGIGTPTGSPIPIEGKGSGNFRKDKEGTTVITRLNETMLQKIAAAGNGKYYSGLLAISGFNALADELDKLEKTEVESKVFTDYESVYQYPLALAFLLLLLESLLSERRIRRPAWLGKYLKSIKIPK